MKHNYLAVLSALCFFSNLSAQPGQLPQPANSWLKRSPLSDAPQSPSLSYETSLAYDPVAQRVIRWGGHAQGGVKGSGEQIAELWTLDPSTMKWEIKESNQSPPAVCCAQQNVFDTSGNRFLRFKSFSGNHGWQWFREIYLNNSSVWNFDLAANTWRNARPLPEPVIGALHCASWDSDQQVAVVFGGEGTEEGTFIYDPYANRWTRRQTATQPAPRSGGNMAYDAARKLHILFGSQFSDDPHTWGYDVAKNEWRDLKPSVQPPTDRNDAVLAYDSVNQMVLAVVRVVDASEGKQPVKGHLETWTYDGARNTWKHMKAEREPDGWGNRSRALTYVSDENFFLLEVYVHPTQRVPGVEREQQIWTYRIAERKADAPPAPIRKARTQPPIVEDAVVSVLAPQQVEIAWKAVPSKDVTGYHVERAVVEVFSEDEVLRLKKDTPPLAEPSVGAIKAIGPFLRLTKDPVRVARFADTTVDLAKPNPVVGEALLRHRWRADQLDDKAKPYRFGVYAYRIRSVNGQGVESGPSPYFLTIPSAPQYVFSREEEGQCHLKWQANPEQNIKGYRIYWMKGPRPEGPGQPTYRLTPDPVAETRFTDDKAGREVRRYWIVAVDALGQEGIPSTPTWHYRTCRSFYEPFVKEWHQ